MKKRRVLRMERLEARETPDVSLCPAACPAPLTANLAAPAGPVAAPGPGQPGGVPGEGLSLRALETIFSSPAEMAKLLGRPAEPPEGWQFLSNYARKAIRNEELHYGALPDHDDILHEIYVEWREQVGSGDSSLAGLLHKDSAERQVLRKAVRRVLDHARYEHTRQKRVLELHDQPAPARPAGREWADVRLDWSLGVGGLGAREKQVLELRSQGMTFEEIGAEMGLLKQRVFEMYSAAMDRLQEAYGDVSAGVSP
jgi:DNA-directed RNA polymerase specialized sigma24 family protein